LMLRFSKPLHHMSTGRGCFTSAGEASASQRTPPSK
jgi:hypothetical protein